MTSPYEERLLELKREELEFNKAQAAQKSKEDKAANGPAGIASGVLGMGAAIGGMIPSLLAGGREKDALRKMQAGQGAGAAIARQTASDAAARVVGASTAQPSSGRGGSLREGLRAADQIVQRGAQQASITGAREGLAATQMLRQNDLLRRNAFKTLGAGVGQGLAGIGGMLAASKDQGPVQPGEATDTLPGEGALLEQGTAAQGVGEVPAQGASAQLQATRTLPGAPAGPAGALAGEAPFPPDLQADPRLGQEQYPGAENKGVQVSPEAANIQSLAGITADKQDAAQLVANTGEPTGRVKVVGSPPPPATDPFELQEYVYREVENYMPGPVIFQGMPAEEGLKLLIDLGYPVDYERLGLGPPPDQGPPQATPYESPHAALGRKATAGASAAGSKIRSMFTGEGN